MLKHTQTHTHEATVEDCTHIHTALDINTCILTLILEEVSTFTIKKTLVVKIESFQGISESLSAAVTFKVSQKVNKYSENVDNN